MVYEILIVDDHPIFRAGLSALLDNEKTIEICGNASDVSSALSLFETLTPDLVLVDLSLEGRSGLQLIKILRSRSKSVKILVVSMHTEALYAEKTLEAGANGYINKTEASISVVHAIHTVLSGTLYLSKEFSDYIVRKRFLPSCNADAQPSLSHESTLSNREIEVFELIGKGISTKAIAELLSISSKTVDAHKEHIKKKLGISNNCALIQRAVAWDISTSII